MKLLVKKLLRIFGYTGTLTFEEQLQCICSQLKKEKNNLTLILPKQFRNEFAKNSYVSGGCIYSLFHKQEPKDYDFFLKREELATKMREYFYEASSYKGEGICGGRYEDLPLVVTDNAISLGRYQIITKFTGEPEEVVGEFDFKHNQYYYINGEIKDLNGFEHLKSKELNYNEKRARDIVGTIIRIPKFIQRGMSISSKETAKMLLRLHEVGFNERELEILKSTTSTKHFGS